MYSNVRVDGVRAHELARAGAGADPSPREVEVHALTLTQSAPDTLVMHCTTASGTYIRSLARDIASALGTCGHLTVLRRVSIGRWSVSEEPTVTATSEIKREADDFAFLDFFPVVHVTIVESYKYLNGNPFSPESPPGQAGVYRVAAPENFLGLGHYDGEKLTVEKVYPTAPGSTYPMLATE